MSGYAIAVIVMLIMFVALMIHLLQDPVEDAAAVAAGESETELPPVASIDPVESGVAAPIVNDTDAVPDQETASPEADVLDVAPPDPEYQPIVSDAVPAEEQPENSAEIEFETTPTEATGLELEDDSAAPLASDPDDI